MKSIGKVHVKKVASFVGHTISMVIKLIEHVAFMMTKTLSADIKKASTWFSLITLSDESKEQLKWWQQNIRSINRKKMFCIIKCSTMIFSDASASGFAGFQVSTLNKVEHGIWSPDEMVKSST